MRVLITTPVFPPELGGPATFVPIFARHLLEGGHSATIVTFADEEPDLNGLGLDAAEKSRFCLITIRRIWLPVRYARFYFRVFREALRSEVLFSCEHPRVLTVAIARLLRRKVVARMMVDTAWEQAFRFGWTTASPEDYRSRPRRGREQLLQVLQQWCLTKVDLVVAVSEHLAETARSMGSPPDRVRVLFNLPPAPPEAIPSRSEARRLLGGQEHEFRLLVVARLVPWKGVSAVLDALEELADSYKLTILGDGPLRGSLQDRVERSPNLRARVELLGAVDWRTVHLYMRGSDVLVLNSLYEGLSHVVLEAFDAALPVIAAENPGNRELIEAGVNGELFPYGDVPSIRELLLALRDHPERRSRYTAASRRRLEELRARSSLGFLEDEILSLIGEQPRAPGAAQRRV